MTSSELLLVSAERYASLISMAAKISGETVRQSRLNIGMKNISEDLSLLYVLHKLCLCFLYNTL